MRVFRFFKLSLRKQVKLVTATVGSLIFRALIEFGPKQWINKMVLLAQKKADKQSKANINIDHLDEWRWAFDTAKNHLPDKINCLSQALAAYWIFVLQKKQPKIKFGALKDHNQLKAHAWLFIGPYQVTGGTDSSQYLSFN